MKNIISGVYAIKNTINDRYYIGFSQDVYQRWSKHKNDLNNNLHINRPLQRDWNMYGESRFSFIILEVVDSAKSMFAAETHWMRHFNNIYNKVSKRPGIAQENAGSFQHERSVSQNMLTLKQWREKRGLTQFQLSTKSGVSLSSISTFEGGRHTLSIKNAIKIADALGLTLNDIIWQIPNESNSRE